MYTARVLTRGFGPTCWLMVGALLLVVAKRLEANRSPLPDDKAMRRRVIWLRLLYDRDVPPGVAGTDRTPTA